MTSDPAVLVTVAGAVGEIVLNRPGQRNALNGPMCDALLAAALQMEADETVSAVIVRAEGPVFCAGADLKERQGMDAAAAAARRLKAFAAYSALEALSKPVIAAVQGPAVGSGGEIASACDFIIAADGASFRYPEALWGTVGATQRLPRIVGKRLAKELLFTGRSLDAREAAAAGLVNRVVPADDLLRVVREMAAQIASAPAHAIRAAKRCIDRGVETDPAGALAIELGEIEALLATEHWKAGIAGFGTGENRPNEGSSKG